MTPTPSPAVNVDAPASLRLLILGNADSVHVQRWAGTIAGHGHDVTVGSLGAPRDSDGGATYAIRRLGGAVTAAVGARRLARSLRPDVVHAHNLSYYGWYAWAAGRRPYIVTAWGSDVLVDLPRSRVRRQLARLVLPRAAAVTADAPGLLEAMVGLGAPADAAYDVQFGVDTARFAPGPKPDWLARQLDVVGCRVVFSPRSLTPLYRVSVLVEALARLEADVVLVLTMAGGDAAFAQRLRDAATALGVEARLRFAPAIPHGEIDAYYRLADVVASVPASDGTPVSVLEAMATGTPVVATALPAVVPWLSASGSDLLVPVDDVEATANALSRALSMDAARRADAGRASRQVAVERADHDASMRRMEDIYRRVAAR